MLIEKSNNPLKLPPLSFQYLKPHSKYMSIDTNSSMFSKNLTTETSLSTFENFKYKIKKKKKKNNFLERSYVKFNKKDLESIKKQSEKLVDILLNNDEIHENESFEKVNITNENELKNALDPLTLIKFKQIHGNELHYKQQYKGHNYGIPCKINTYPINTIKYRNISVFHEEDAKNSNKKIQNALNLNSKPVKSLIFSKQNYNKNTRMKTIKISNKEHDKIIKSLKEKNLIDFDKKIDNFIKRSQNYLQFVESIESDIRKKQEILNQI